MNKSISTLAKADLIAKVKNAKYDGYRLTYGGLDYLALHSHVRSGAIAHLGSQMGVGKESDIYLITTPAGTWDNGEPRAEQAILKLHRLGRTSFRSLKNTRTYHKHRQHCSWQYLSRLSAQKEYAAMTALYRAGYPVPKPIAWNRHAVVMSLVPGTPMRAVPLSAFGAADTSARRESRDARIEALYGECMELALRFAEVGVIHGDFNEFNILIEGVPEEEEDEAAPDEPSSKQPAPMKPWSIDFPQVTSLSHTQAAFYFQRDIDCIKRFFEKRYHFISASTGPHFDEAMQRLKRANSAKRIDVEIEAAGFSKKMAKELDRYYAEPEAEAGQLPEDRGEEDEDDAANAEDEESGLEGFGSVDENGSALNAGDRGADGDGESNQALWQELLLENGASNLALDGEGNEPNPAPRADNVERLTVDALRSLELKSTATQAKSVPKAKTKKAAGWAI